MKITVLGATGKTGQEVVKQALEAGHSVTALVRRSGILPEHDKLRVVMGDVTNAQDVAKASKGSDVVISALGSNEGILMSPAVEAVILASKMTGVKRFILMSGFLVNRDQLDAGAKAISLAMKGTLHDKAESETLLRESDLNWTIVYALLSMLRNPAEEGNHEPGRLDYHKFLLD